MGICARKAALQAVHLACERIVSGAKGKAASPKIACIMDVTASAKNECFAETRTYASQERGFVSTMH